MKRLNQSGLSHVLVLVLLVAVLGAVGFIGYRVMNLQSSNSSTPDVAATAAAAEQKAIDAKPALKTVDTTLSDVNAELNNSLDTSTLDADIQALY